SAGQRAAPGLRWRCLASESSAARRYCLPHRARQLLFPAPGHQRRNGHVAGRRSGTERPGDHLQMTYDSAQILARLADTLESRLPANGGDPSSSYTAKLLAKGPDAFLKKIGEEATELVMAAKDNTP